MVMNTIAAATPDVGGGTVVSFGSGDSGGRLAASARGRGGRNNAGTGQVRSVRNEINRSNLSARRKRQLLQEIDDNRNPRTGNINRGILRDILEEFRELIG